ncbi:MAG: response regulator, partial [Anaerolineae bacterium]|nr:response regulator [Anaerolineae bacterium]
MTKILVIEDEHVLLLTIQQMLQFEDYEVVIASDGVEGVAMARQHLPDLIVCDIMMPRLDGYGVLQALREDSATRAIPFIFLTAKVERDHQRQG